MLALAANSAGTTETKAVIQALEGLEYEAPMGKLIINKSDHQAIANVTWGKTAANPDYKFRILEPIVVVEGDSITRASKQTKCKISI